MLLTISLRNERLQLLNKLAVAWDDPLDGTAAARQVARNVTSTLGFDFATVSVVDAEHNQICTEAGSNAAWVEEAQHDLGEDDVQCRVVGEGVTMVNYGQYEPYLDKAIWERHGHARTTRIWAPIKQPYGKGPEEVFGTVEAGFYHEHCREISPDLRWLLERYAEMVSPVLLSTRQHTRNQRVVATLEKLNAVGDKLNQQANTLNPDDMACLIGGCAEDVLGADLVMVFLPHKGRKRPKLIYMTEEPASGLLAEDRVRITPYLSEALELKFSSDRAPYLSSIAQEDPVLVRFGLDGLPDGRSFTQRHDIRSFAGVPLITKAGAIVGYLCLNYLVHHEFYPEIQQMMHLFAEQAATALQQTRDQRLALAVAIEHERGEMAAIVHNRLSGGLATNYTLALTAVEYARSGDPRLAEKLQEVLQSIDQNKRELRQLLVDVRGVDALRIDLARGVEARVKISKGLQRAPVSLDVRY